MRDDLNKLNNAINLLENNPRNTREGIEESRLLFLSVLKLERNI